MIKRKINIYKERQMIERKRKQKERLMIERKMDDRKKDG